MAAYYLGSSLKDSDKTEKKQPDVKLEQVLESVPSFNNTFIQEVIRLVDENLQNPDFKIDDLAETMNMTVPYSYRKIKTFTELLRRFGERDAFWKRALELLDADTYSLSEVAYQSGFSSPRTSVAYLKNRCSAHRMNIRDEKQ